MQQGEKANRSLKRLLDLTTEWIVTVTAKDWEGYCQHVQQLEQYWKRDGVAADVIDSAIIVNTNDSSDDEETSCEDAESEEETEFSDSELTRPL
jgi:hypothetical protein